MRIHRAIRILQADRRGSSLPVIIETEAGLFFTKLRGATQGTSALVAEIIVAALAEALGLRVPQRVLINIDDTTVSEDRNDELADLLAASRGCNLGFEWLEAAADLQPEDLPGIDRETASKILWLDGLVMNPDRTAQNPNLLMRGEHLWLIDHGAALGFYHNWSSVTEDSPARVLATMSRHVMREHATDLARLDDVLAQRLNRDVIRSAVEQVPDDFLRPLLPKPISRTLSRRREAYCAFLWKRLKKPRRFAMNMDSLETVADFAQETTGVPPDCCSKQSEPLILAARISLSTHRRPLDRKIFMRKSIMPFPNSWSEIPSWLTRRGVFNGARPSRPQPVRTHRALWRSASTQQHDWITPALRPGWPHSELSANQDREFAATIVAIVIGLLIFILPLAVFAQPTSDSSALAKLPPDHAERMTRGLKLFDQSVRALLNEQCVKCHGGEKTKGEFDLTTREGLLKGGAEGPTVVLWDSQASKLVKLISHTDKPHMPSKQEKLSDDAIQQIAAWIDNGAPYDKPLLEKSPAGKARSTVTDADRDYWAFRPLKQVEAPNVADPKTKSWARTPIDNFVLEKLTAKNLKPNPIAAKRKLIRRAYFDLIGRPPKPDEVEAFVKDTSPAAYARLIDRLLASPHYGERWGRHWLDVARFAESHGFEHDYNRPFAYHFRDFVIKALNQDMPYDQFVKWQLAGDEFEPDNPLALMATGFLGAGVFPTQITANEVERTRYDALDDMLSTTGTAMLGLTVGCARCHDHKFDPIPASDYYRLLSTFTTTVRSDIELDLNPEIFRAEKVKFDAEHAPLVAALEKYEREQLPIRFEQWRASGAQMPAHPGWTVLELASFKSSGGATFTKLDDGSLLASGANADFDTYTFVANTETKGITAIRLEALAQESFVKGGPGRAGNGNFGLGRIKLTAAPLSDPTKSVEVNLVNPKASFEQNDKNLSIAASLDGDKKTGWAIDPQFGKDHAAVFETESEIGFDGGTVLTFTLEFTVNNQHNIGRPRLSITTAPKPVGLDGTVIPAQVTVTLAALHAGKSAAALLTEDRAGLIAWWKTTEPGWQQLNEPIRAHLKQAPKPNLTKVMVCAEGYPPMRWHTQGADFFPETHLLNRGNTDQKRGVASQSFLQVLMRAPAKETHWQIPPPEGARFSNRRRALANWMTDTEQGAGHLLARVIVNRLWQHHFGEGIVATPNDFGVQGQRPTHPELLDWLADELIRSGWRLKPLHKLIMTSAVYMQDTQSDSQKEKLDPNNQLLSRRVPRRLEAEVIRDSVLAVSGTLVEKMFGPGTLDSKENRRSIYFTIKRSQLVPMMQLFDAPEPLVSMGNRPTTTIAPQALLFMNNANVRAAAASFAKQLEPTAAKSMPHAIKSCYAIALGHPPTNAELTEALAFVRQQRKNYDADKKSNARELALADFCQVVMSLNEFVYTE